MFVFELVSFEVVAYMYIQKTFFCPVAYLTLWRFCYDKARELKFAFIFINNENKVQKSFFVFEIFSFEVDAYTYVQKMIFCAVADLT
jgi:hypothetical protein